MQAMQASGHLPYTLVYRLPLLNRMLQFHTLRKSILFKRIKPREAIDVSLLE